MNLDFIFFTKSHSYYDTNFYLLWTLFLGHELYFT